MNKQTKTNKNYIERYVYDVTRRIEDKQREDIKKELTSQIYDMLPENPSDEEIQAVLLSLGTPREMASKYRSNEKNYLISPKYYQDYITTLKIVAIIFSSLTLVLSVMSFVFAINTIGIEAAAEIFADEIVTNVIQSLFSTFGIVTLIYFILERYDVKLDKYKKTFNLNCLPELPKHESLEVNRFGRIFAMVFNISFTAFFVYLFLNHSQFIGYYAKEDDVYVFTQIFNDNIKFFIIPIIVVSALDTIKYIYQISKGVQTKASIIMSTAFDLTSLLLLLIMLTTKGLIHQGFFDRLTQVFETDLANVMAGYDIFLNIAYGSILFVGIVILADGLYKLFKFNKVSK